MKGASRRVLAGRGTRRARAARTCRTSSDRSPAVIGAWQVTLAGMNNWQKQAARAGARQVARAVAEREQGRRWLNGATATVAVSSVAAAGVIAVILPGTTHTAAKSGGSSSSSTPSSSTPSSSAPASSAPSSDSGGSSDDGSGNSSSPSGNSGFQAPANPPQVSTGSGSVSATSGGS